MLVFGTGGFNAAMTPEQEEEWKEFLAEKMRQLLEEAGWSSSYGQDPILILIEFEDNPESED